MIFKVSQSADFLIYFLAVLCNSNLISVFILKCVLWCWWFWGIGGLFTSKNICEKHLVCCICNVSCLCPTSLTCNPMSRRRKEKDSLMRFVIVSMVSFTWLIPPLNLQPSTFLLSLICLTGSGRQWSARSVPASSCCRSSFHKPTGAPGEWGTETVPRGLAGSCHSPPTTSRKISQG